MFVFQVFDFLHINLHLQRVVLGEGLHLTNLGRNSELHLTEVALRDGKE